MGILVSTYTRRAYAFLVFLILSANTFADVLSSVSAKFPMCKITMETLFPNEQELKTINSKNKTKFFNYFKKECANENSTVFVLSDLIRTQQQFVLVEIKDRKIKNIEILKFLEPAEYKVANYWLSKFEGLAGGFQNIDAVSGATLTSGSINYLALLSLRLDGIINGHAKK